MILLDTSVWVDHLRSTDTEVVERLRAGAILGHPWVTGEVALGRLRRRGEILALLRQIPQAAIADIAELARFIDAAGIHGRGIGYVDAQLLAATRLTPGARLWTRDGRLRAVAVELGCDAGLA